MCLPNLVIGSKTCLKLKSLVAIFCIPFGISKGRKVDMRAVTASSILPCMLLLSNRPSTCRLEVA